MYLKQGLYHGFIVVCHGSKADVVFLLDSSASEGAVNFEHQLDFVKNFTDKFDIGPDAVQIGLATFSTKPHGHFWLDTYQNKTDLINATGHVPYIPGSTYTDLGLKFALVRIRSCLRLHFTENCRTKTKAIKWPAHCRMKVLALEMELEMEVFQKY